MNDIYKIIVIGIVTTILAILVRRYKPELSIGIAITGGATILFLLLGPMSAVVDTITTLSSKMGIDIAYIQLVIKVIGVAYLVQFAAETARDAGESSIASSIELAGKVCIFTMAAPVMMSLLDVVVKLIP